MTFFSKDHPITEKGMMEFQPFGKGPDGRMIHDLSGVAIKAAVERLEVVVTRRHGPEAGRQAVEEHVRRLNARIPDGAYRVTADFLKNPWNGYSAEFGAFNGQFTLDISGDPHFNFGMGREIPPIIQVLGRPFSVPQIYKMSAYFSQRYGKDSFLVDAVSVSGQSAVMRMSFSERMCRHFGPYRRGCAYLWCEAVKGYLTGVPEQFHHRSPAVVEDQRCIAEGDEYCEWNVTWSVKNRRVWHVATRLAERRESAEDTDTAENELTQSLLPAQPVLSGPRRDTMLLSKDHLITEKGMMEFQPFGIEADGTPIRDLGGVTIRACVDYLEEYVGQTAGPAKGKHAVEELVRSLNERIPERCYYVTADFLRNSWNSYSYEFAAFLSEFCSQISGDPQFQFNMARRSISPFIQVLGRPFSVPRIYRLSPYFAQIYSGKNVYSVEALSISDRSGVLRMRFGERAYRHFGPYLKRCALHWCNGHKGYFVAVPEKFHQLPPANIRDRACIAEGDSYCEWEVTWAVKERSLGIKPLVVSLASWTLRKDIEERERLIDEQVRTLDARHVELQEAYVQQQQITAELQRRVEQLTTLHDAGLVFSSILDREALIARVLQTVTQNLHYDRAMLRFFDGDRGVTHDARIIGVPEELAEVVRSLEVPVHDPESLEGKVFLRGEPILIGDIQHEMHLLHPLNQQLALMAQAKSIISVPLKVKNKILGSLTVDCARDHSLTQDDLSVMVTLASQVAIALDNAYAYRQIEEFSISLEAKVRERTASLEEFLARISHDLRTPLTSITGFVENMLDGLAGSVTEKQQRYLTRMLANGRRLGRLVDNLLDMLVDPDRIKLSLEEVDLPPLVVEVVEQLRPLAQAKQQSLETQFVDEPLLVWADADKLTRVLMNLVDNAIKYTPSKGSVLVKVAAADRHFAQVSVSDNGEGIPAEALAKIFDPSFRVGAPVKSHVKSHGLGLSIVKDLVERHGGTVTVHSEVNKGSEFTFTIPIRYTFRSRVPASIHEVKRLLVADDDPDITQMLLDRLTSDGYLVQTANDGDEALAALRSSKFDGLILDIGMPKKDGLEVLHKIREEQPVLPVIMITAAATRDRALVAMQAGAQDYLLKPFDGEQLKMVVERWVAGNA
jgi:signal transduction histidine kinase